MISISPTYTALIQGCMHFHNSRQVFDLCSLIFFPLADLVWVSLQSNSWKEFMAFTYGMIQFNKSEFRFKELHFFCNITKSYWGGTSFKQVFNATCLNCNTSILFFMLFVRCNFIVCPIISVLISFKLANEP